MAVALAATGRSSITASVVIAAITSCTNTSNPSVMIGAGLLAKKAVEKGLTRKPWVKTSLAPGSKVVTEYLERRGPHAVPRPARLQPRRLRLHDLHRQQRSAAGRGVADDQATTNLVVASVLSGNRNFEGRIQPEVRANYLASPPLVVAYALAGTIRSDLDDRAARRRQGRQAGLPQGHLADRSRRSRPTMARRRHAGDVPQAATRTSSSGDEQLAAARRADRRAASSGTRTRPTSASRRSSTACTTRGRRRRAHHGARVLALLGDSVTTDHISPAGSIKADSPAGKYLIENGVKPVGLQLATARAAATTR